MSESMTNAVLHLEALTLRGLYKEAQTFMDKMTAEELSIVSPLMTINASMIQKGHSQDFRAAFLADTESKCLARRREESAP